MCDTREYETLTNPSNVEPLINGSLHPVGHGNRAHMTTLTEQVDDGPVFVSLMKVRQLQTDQLGTPQAAAQQKGQDAMISLAFCFVCIRGLKKPLGRNATLMSRCFLGRDQSQPVLMVPAPRECSDSVHESS
jgi:hypothetical protein